MACYLSYYLSIVFCFGLKNTCIIFTVVVTLVLRNIVFSGSTYLCTTLAEFNLERLISAVSIDIDPEGTDALLKQSSLTKQQVTFVVAAHRLITYL